LQSACAATRYQARLVGGFPRCTSVRQFVRRSPASTGAPSSPCGFCDLGPRPGQRMPTTTDPAQTRVVAGCGAVNAHEAGREKRRQRGRKRAETQPYEGSAFTRPRRKTAPTLALQTKKSQPEKGWDFGYWWWDGTPHQTTIESTESKRCGLLRTIANSIKKSADAPSGCGRSSRFYAAIGHRQGRSTSSAFRRQFNSRFGNRTRVRQIATFHSRNWPTVCVSPCLSSVSRYSSTVLGGFFSDRR
jgi:hypothetical protein